MDGNATAYLEEIELTNTGGQPLTVDAWGWSAATTGGWIVKADHEELLGGPLLLDAGATFTMPIYQQFDGSPLAQVVVRANTSAGDVLVELPIVLDSTTTWPAGVDPPTALTAGGQLTPPPFDAASPVFVALTAPVEVVPLWDGTSRRSWVGVAGQLVNWSARDLTLASWRLTIRPRWLRTVLRGRTVLDTTPPTFKPADDLLGATVVDLGSAPGLAAHSAVGFLAGYAIDWDGGGYVSVELTLEDGATTTTVTRTVSLGSAPIVELRPPVEWSAPGGALWGFGNGPGAGAFHVHNVFPDRRYAYDIGFALPDGTFLIDPGRPEESWNYLCWSRTIVAMADGVVVAVDDSSPDHAPGVTTGKANSVVLHHDDPRFPNHVYTVYVHMRQGSAMVQPGDRVAAGDPIALIGNNGWSTAPHLHVGCFTYDDVGRLRALPMAFDGLETSQPGPAVPADGARFPVVPG